MGFACLFKREVLVGIVKGLLLGAVLSLFSITFMFVTNYSSWVAFAPLLVFVLVVFLWACIKRSFGWGFLHGTGVWLSFVLCIEGFVVMLYELFQIWGFDGPSPPRFWDLGWGMFFSGVVLFGLVFFAGRRFSKLTRIKTYVMVAFCVLVVALAKEGIESYPTIRALRVYDVVSYPSGDLTVVQGSAQVLNFTFKSFWDKQVVIPVEGLESRSSSVPLDDLFSYSLSTNELILHPNKTASVLVTLEPAQNALTGNYTLSLRLGEYNNGFYERIQSMACGFKIQVTPKQ